MADGVKGERGKCGRCDGDRRIYNALLKRMIRCPYCKPRPRRRNAQAIREFIQRDRRQLSAPEQERMLRALERTLAEAIADRFNDANLPPHLITTDRILKRWAAEGTGAPADNPDVYFESQPPPLDPATYAVVEACIAKIPKDLRSLTRAWYRTKASTKQLATRRGISVRTLGKRWWDALVELRERFLASRHADLIALVRAQ